MARRDLLKRVLQDTSAATTKKKRLLNAEQKAEELRRAYKRLSDADQRNKAASTREGRGSATDARAKEWPLVITIEPDRLNRRAGLSIYIDPEQQRPVRYEHSFF